METRPILKITLTKTDKVIEVLCLLLLIVLWTGTLAGFSSLPDQIPSHYNAAGKVDKHSDKSSILMLPVIATIIYIGITILNRYPHIYNYLDKVTEENARDLYTSTTRVIRVMKLVVIIIFSSIVFFTYRVVYNDANSLGAWFLPAALGLISIPTIYMLIQKRPSKQ